MTVAKTNLDLAHVRVENQQRRFVAVEQKLWRSVRVAWQDAEILCADNRFQSADAGQAQSRPLDPAAASFPRETDRRGFERNIDDDRAEIVLQLDRRDFADVDAAMTKHVARFDAVALL